MRIDAHEGYLSEGPLPYHLAHAVEVHAATGAPLEIKHQSPQILPLLTHKLIQWTWHHSSSGDSALEDFSFRITPTKSSNLSREAKRWTH